MTFRLWHLFVLMSAVAAWFAALKFSPNLAIVVGVSIVPGLISFVVAGAVWSAKVTGLSISRKCLWIG
jgi:hypothetical protein